MEKKWKVRKVPVFLFLAFLVLACVSFVWAKAEYKKAKKIEAYEKGFIRLMDKLPKETKEKALKDLSALKTFKEKKMVWYDGGEEVGQPDKIMAIVVPDDVDLGTNLMIYDRGVLLVRGEEMTEDWAGLALLYGLTKAYLEVEKAGLELNEDMSEKLAEAGDVKFFFMGRAIVNHISEGGLDGGIKSLVEENGLHSVEDVANLFVNNPGKIKEMVERLDSVFSKSASLSPIEEGIRSVFYVTAICFYIVDQNTSDLSLRGAEYIAAMHIMSDAADELIEKYQNRVSA